MKIAIITGASSGLGAEFARQLDQEKHFDAFWLIARRKKAMEDLAKTLSHPCKIFPMDVGQGFAPIQEALEKDHGEISYLVNAAGFGKIGDFSKVAWKDTKGMIDVNITALTELTYLALPYMEKGGSIFQFASVAAFLPQPGFAIYAATKAYVLSLSRAIHAELKGNVKVVAICPNPVETEFFTHAGGQKEIHSIKKIGLEKKEVVISTAIHRAKRGKDISLSTWSSKWIRFFSRILPHPWILSVEKWILK